MVKKAKKIDAEEATPQRNVPAFREDVVNLFRRNKGGHLAPWVYHNGNRGGHQPTGNTLWTEFLRVHGAPATGSYYILQEEIDLLKWKESSERLIRRLQGAKVIVDIGSGGAEAVNNKAMKIVLASPEVTTYCPVDLSYGLLDEATKAAIKTIEESQQGIKVLPINADFYKAVNADGTPIVIPEMKNRRCRNADRAGLFLGSTITNMPMKIDEGMPRDRIVERIQQVSRFLRTGADSKTEVTITFGYDANPDMDDAASAYQGEIWSQLVVGVMSDLQNVLKPHGHFNPVGWKHEIVIDYENHVLHQCAVATEDQSFDIGDEHFEIKEGDRFVIKNNFKYPYALFKEMCEEAGLIIEDEPIKHPSGRMLLQTAVVPPEIMEAQIS